MLILSATLGMASVGMGQATNPAEFDTHTLSLEVVAPPTGPNSEFLVNLKMSPSDVDISGIQINVGYDTSKGDFIDIIDNTGQGQASGIDYGIGVDTVLTGVPYADRCNQLYASTVFGLINPTNLAQLKFKTSATYNEPGGIFWIYIGPYPTGGLFGAFDSDGPDSIPIAFNSLEPAPARISLWTLY